MEDYRKMKKLLVSIGTLSSGGAERVISILSDAFAEHYDEVIYLTWIDKPDFYVLNPKIKRVCIERECGSSNILRKTIWFRSFVKKESPTIILSFLTPFNVLICYSLLGLNVKLIVAERNDPRKVWNGNFKKNIRNVAYRFADGILEQTENNRSYFSGTLLKRTGVVYNPIIMSDEYVGSALKATKKNRIVSVMRLTAQKNPEMLLNSFFIFHNSHKEYTLTIYGEGPYREKIKRMVGDLGLQGFVFLPGAIKNVWDEIIDAKCFIMTSWYEGMPNALLEAMCLGLPCVSTKVSGAVDLINDGDNGYLVELNDHVSMANVISKVVDDDIIRCKLGTNASKLYNLLNIDVISKKWLEYIDMIINK